MFYIFFSWKVINILDTNHQILALAVKLSRFFEKFLKAASVSLTFQWPLSRTPEQMVSSGNVIPNKNATFKYIP